MIIYASSILLALALASPAQENLLVNGDFEQGLAGWSDLWTRTPGGKLSLDPQQRHGGAQAARIEHTGSEDWSLAQQRSLEVKPGQIYALGGWVRVTGQGDTTLCVTLRDASEKVTDWVFAGQTTGATEGWRLLRSRFVVPPGSKTVQARLIGHGPATVWFDDARLVLQGSVDEMRRKDLPATLRAENRFLDVVLRTADGSLSVTDRRSGRCWTAVAPQPHRRARRPGRRVRFPSDHAGPGHDAPAGGHGSPGTRAARGCRGVGRQGRNAQPDSFPAASGDRSRDLSHPAVNEGISYPAADPTIEPAYHYLYGGHGLCMAWYGQTDGRRGVMTIVETPDDAGVRMIRREGLLSLSPEWEPQKGQFGYARRLR